ncbi:protein WEAK CHLOROPLAST MOVEMENT UNDER BLUE LIGHT 1-like isoform X1 [Musa acuminata AAA Group]|uniref:protein WEAK CHLOROPLAST MOVEMENT UNDER BLUE LIGHT 1-like isoform X1 n=2 Tax=Musa acuminata AAA Group TaxID=214697 RepID=UPI0031DE62EE
MEATRDTCTDLSGVSPTTMSFSTECLPTSAATLTSTVVEKNSDNSCLQGKGMHAFETKNEQYLSDPSPLDNYIPMSEYINTNSKQEGAVEDSVSSVQQNLLDITSQHVAIAENFDSHHQQQTVVEESEPLVLQDIPDASTMDKNKPNTMESLNISGTPTDDAVVVLPETVTYLPSHSLDASKAELENISKHENETFVKVDPIQISNDSSASTETRNTEGRPSLQPSDLSHIQVLRHTQKKTPESTKSSIHRKDDNANRGFVDTAAPIESVKEVVTKFGGIIDWKAHKAHNLEKQKHVQSELEKIREEIPECKRQSEASEEAKIQVLKELESMKRIIEELKLNLDRARKEEAQAKQDSELAQLRVKELEQGIANESSIVAKTQLEVAKERHEAAVAELKSVKDDLQALQREYDSLISERDIAMRKAEKAVSSAKDIEKTVEELTLELIAKKESLESAHVAHLEAEEHRIGAALARDQDCFTWAKELKQAEEEVQQLNQQLTLTKDLKLKLDASCTLLQTFKAELEAYMKAKLKQESESTDNEKIPDDVEETKGTMSSIQAIDSTRKALEEVKASIEKAKDEVNCLSVAASSLKTELDAEKAALSTLKQMEGMASIAVSSLEAELDRTRQELEVVRMKEKEAREKMVELPKLMQQAAQEADQAKSVAQMARDELRKAKEEAEQAKAASSTTQIKLHAVLKETEAAKASEKLAMARVKALQESEQAAGMGGADSPAGVTLPLDEYSTLCKTAHEAEELAHERVAAALAQIEVAKKSERSSIERLEQTYREMDQCKQALRVAIEKAEKAKEGKLGAEQELRKWRAELKQRRRATDAAKGTINPPPRSFEQSSEPKSSSKEATDVHVHPEPENAEHDAPARNKTKKKKPLFPRIVLFLARKKPQPVK